jgi:hypothetical protein
MPKINRNRPIILFQLKKEDFFLKSNTWIPLQIKNAASNVLIARTQTSPGVLIRNSPREIILSHVTWQINKASDISAAQVSCLHYAYSYSYNPQMDQPKL